MRSSRKLSKKDLTAYFKAIDLNSVIEKEFAKLIQLTEDELIKELNK